jgi:hypothetical protein
MPGAHSWISDRQTRAVEAPTITPEEVKGFSLGLLRAAVSGRDDDEVVDLAKTNSLPW